MKATKNGIAVSGLALIASLVAHLLVLGNVMGVTFPRAFDSGVLLTAVITEAPHVPGSAGPTEETGTVTGIKGLPKDGVVIGKRLRKEERRGVVEPRAGGAPAGSVPEYGHRIGRQQEPAEAEDSVTTGSGGNEPAQAWRAEGSLKSFREKLSYDLYWLGIYVGNAVLEAVAQDNVMTITTEAHSAAFISNFYKVEDHSESRIVDGMPFSFRIRQQEGKYRSDKETRFDVKEKKVVYVDYLKDLSDEQGFDVSVVWDVVSGFYHLRTRHLEIGKTVYVDVFDSDKFLSVEVNVVRKDRVAMPGSGEVDAIVIRPQLRSEGLFQKKGDILVWITDDENRTPVRVETEVPVGKVVAKLKGVETGRRETPEKTMDGLFSYHERCCRSF